MVLGSKNWFEKIGTAWPGGLTKQEKDNDMTVHDIIHTYLKNNNFGGLCSHNCGCALDDLMCCDGTNTNLCVPGYKRKATQEDVEWMDCEVGDEIISSDNT